MYSCYLFLISSASPRSLLFLFFIVLILAWNFSFITPVSLRSLVISIVLFYSISLHCSFKKAFLFFLVLLWNFAFSWVYLSLSPLPFTSLLSSHFSPFLSFNICKTSSDNHFVFLHFFFFGMDSFSHCLLTVLGTSFHCSSCTLPSSSNPLNLFITSIV